ncbi:MAG TPA: filamentous hemagglutinin N-terminal domain-containing protein [Gammaproteobacteria bacterium]|nr:filamentous hemagglutinin N-terminal domain-containing protein [Gammaproteobacteria bacterium]
MMLRLSAKNYLVILTWKPMITKGVSVASNTCSDGSNFLPAIHCLIPLLICLLILTLPGRAYSEVGAEITPSAATVVAADRDGSRINISGGIHKGGNLFHNFERFSIGKGQTAFFQNTTQLSVENVISLVTSKASEIDGEINSRDFGYANLFLINPNGITFGTNAKLEVGGSFFATTAERLHFEDGSTLITSTEGGGNLSSAPISAFGFLDEVAAPVQISGSALKVADSQGLTIAAGNITIDDATLRADGGEIRLLSRADSAGNITLDSSPSANGDKYIDLGAVALSSGTTIRGTGEGSSVEIKAETLSMEGDGTKIRMKNSGNGEAVDINLSGDLSVSDGASITTAASAGSDAADIEIVVKDGDVIVTGLSEGFIPRGSQINSSATGGGIAGDISVSAIRGAVRITDSGNIQAASSGFGSAAAAGNITLEVDELVIENGGQITNKASGEGVGGTITVAANTLKISGEQPGIQSETTGSGDAGNIMIHPGENNLVVKGGGTISADSRGDNATGNAGDISIEAAKGDILITDGVKISAKTITSGQGGSIKVVARNINITDGASLTAESQFEGSNSPSNVDNQQHGTSGNISVSATDSVVIDGGKISLSTQQTDAGNIVIRGGKLFRMDNQSEITTSVAGGAGDGGDIRINETIDSNLVVLSNSSAIRANARKGAGGNIDIKAYSHLISANSIIDASAGPAGIDGRVTVTTPDVDATTGILQLPESFLDASTLLDSHCSTRTAGNGSRFVVDADSNMTTPDTLLPGTVSPLGNSATAATGNHPANFSAVPTSMLLSKRSAHGCR